VGEFRVGRVFDRTTAIYTRNFLPFSLVTLIATVPPLLILGGAAVNPYYSGVGGPGAGTILIATLLSVALYLLSQATLVYGAFQDMRGRPVNLSDSVNAALARFFPILGVTLLAAILTGIGFMLLIIPGLILLTMWFVGVPACMVERTGPWQSLVRSAELTKGHRWKVFGIILLFYLATGIIGQIIAVVVASIGGLLVGTIVTALWNTVVYAFFAVFVVVTYYELRSTKEGIDIEQIASVFD
jgi:uncharacterized membrane protein